MARHEEAPPPTGVEQGLCGPGERAEQAALYDLCFGKTDGERVIPWRYDDCPHGAAVSMVARREGQALAAYACFQRRVLHRGEEGAGGRVGQTGDVMTHPEHRGQGYFTDLDRAVLAETSRLGWQAVFGLPNSRSARLFVEKLGWKLVGRIRPWTFVLAFEPSARAERRRAGRLAAAALPWAHWRGTMCRGRLRRRFFERVNVVPLARFDQEVDAVTAAVARDFPWMVRRDHEYLNWRFVDAPSGRFKAHGVYEPAGAMRGYCVVQLPASGESLGHVVDLVALDEIAQAAAMEAALGHLAKAAASVARAHAIEGSRWERTLRESGFRAGKRVDHKSVIAYVHDTTTPVGAATLDPSRWFFTDGDRDDELVG